MPAITTTTTKSRRRDRDRDNDPISPALTSPPLSPLGLGPQPLRNSAITNQHLYQGSRTYSGDLPIGRPSAASVVAAAGMSPHGKSLNTEPPVRGKKGSTPKPNQDDGDWYATSVTSSTGKEREKEKESRRRLHRSSKQPRPSTTPNPIGIIEPSSPAKDSYSYTYAPPSPTSDTNDRPTRYPQPSQDRDKTVPENAQSISSITSHSRSLGYMDAYGNLHKTELGARIANRAVGEGGSAAAAASRRRRSQDMMSYETGSGGRPSVDRSGSPLGKGALPTISERRRARQNDNNVTKERERLRDKGKEKMAEVVYHTTRGHARRKYSGSKQYGPGLGGLVADEEGVEHDPEHMELGQSTHRSYTPTSSSSGSSSSGSSAPSSRSSSSSMMDGNRQHDRVRSLPLNGVIRASTGAQNTRNQQRPASKPRLQKRDSATTGVHSPLSNLPPPPQLVVPIAPKTVGRDLRFKDVIPSAPKYRPANVTDTSMGDRLWRERQNGDLLNILDTQNSNLGASVKSSLIDAAGRAHRHKTAADHGEFLGGVDEPSPGRLSVSNVGSGSYGTRLSGHSPGRLPSRIDDVDVLQAQRASIDLGLGDRRPPSHVANYGAANPDARTSMMLERADGMRENLQDDDLDRYDVDEAASDDSLPMPVLESKFAGDGDGDFSNQTGTRSPSQLSEDSDLRQTRPTLRGQNDSVATSEGKDGKRTVKAKRKKASKKSGKTNGVGLAPTGYGGAAAAGDDPRLAGVGDAWKDGTYGLKRSWNGFTLGARFEVYRAKKKVERAIGGR